MAISLNAEQKNITKIFQGDEQFIVPPYQRPYSWEFDECYQLFLDLMAAYDSDNSYFLGNIILAKSDNSKDVNILQIIDGQQRCISLWLILKVLSILHPDIVKLNRLLAIESWTGESSDPKIKSKIIESDDDNDLIRIFNWSKQAIESELERVIRSNGELNENKANRLLINCLYFYKWFKEAQDKNSDYLKGFVKYILDNVFLLPIELTGSSMSIAMNQALTIFETINNRGKDLEDADIFKAMLYNMASTEDKTDQFLLAWAQIKERTNALGLDVDDLFRYYSHVVRAENGIVSNEIKLRKFFIEEEYSPIKNKSYNEVLKDLFKILDYLEFYRSEKDSVSELGKWLQIVDAYTNVYPKYAVITYLFIRGVDNENTFVEFLKSVIRYVYSKGSTTTVKFEIYNIIYRISKYLDISNPIDSLSSDYFKDMKRLKKGLALIAKYAIEESDTIPFYKLGRLTSGGDSLGNLFISDGTSASKDEITHHIETSYPASSLEESVIQRKEDLETKVKAFIEG